MPGVRMFSLMLSVLFSICLVTEKTEKKKRTARLNANSIDFIITFFLETKLNLLKKRGTFGFLASCII